MWFRFFGFGALFGFILSRVGATQYDAITGMFLLSDLHLMGVIGVAVLVAAVGLRLGRSRGDVIAIAQKPIKHGNIVGGLLFGAGWALSGACPGTSLAQLGEGQLVAMFTIAGIFIGTLLYRRLGTKTEQLISAAKQSLAIKTTVSEQKANSA